jgi:3-isopropylmalate dehydrogenase
LGHYRIAVMPGDGIGPEIVREAVRVLESTAGSTPGLQLDFLTRKVGLEAYRERGETISQSVLEEIVTCDGWLLGPLTTHMYHGASMINVSGFLRKRFDLYANVRPARSLPGVPALHGDVDLVVVRENTEGFYSDRNLLDGNGEMRPDEETVLSLRVVTRRCSLRLARVAFEVARGRRRRVTAVHKANVLRRGCGLFLEACGEVAQQYPDVEFNDLHVDTAAMHLVMRPQEFDVIATTNMFGDILSDEASGLVGGLGLAPGLNVGDQFLMAQATHGSAPDIAGRGIANPSAEILSSALLLRWLGLRRQDSAALSAATRIEQAVEVVLANGTRTPDLGGTASTTQLGMAVAVAVQTV